MKISQIKRIMLYTLVGIISIPALTSAADPIPAVGGSSSTGADSNTSLVDAPTNVVVGGGSSTGADTNTSSVTAPTDVVVGGGSSTGADSNTSSVDAPTGVVVGGGSSTGADANTSTGSTNNGGGSTNTSGGSSSGSSGSRVMVLPIAITPISALVPVSASTSCNYLTSYLKINGNNDYSEVIKLQAFLKNTENINVDTNGIFDTKTFVGVKAFQAKYLNEVMGPWGVNTPTGQVWYTTRKKINEVYCKSPFALSAEQLAQINAYKNNLNQEIINGNVGTNSTNLNITASGTIPLSPEVGSSNDNSSQTASAANTSFGTKIWNFIKWLFGYNNK